MFARWKQQIYNSNVSDSSLSLFFFVRFHFAAPSRIEVNWTIHRNWTLLLRQLFHIDFGLFDLDALHVCAIVRVCECVWTYPIFIHSPHTTIDRARKRERTRTRAIAHENKMPSRLIQGLDSFDTCSQFSDSATLHTLTRVGGLQRAVYFSQSESNFNNFDTISYGNSSTCCCDADIKVKNQTTN